MVSAKRCSEVISEDFLKLALRRVAWIREQQWLVWLIVLGSRLWLVGFHVFSFSWWERNRHYLPFGLGWALPPTWIICLCLPPDRTWHKGRIIVGLSEGEVGREPRLEPCWFMLDINSFSAMWACSKTKLAIGSLDTNVSLTSQAGHELKRKSRHGCLIIA